jgi:hypothetical protein
MLEEIIIPTLFSLGTENTSYEPLFITIKKEDDDFNSFSRALILLMRYNDAYKHITIDSKRLGTRALKTVALKIACKLT